MQLDSVTGPSVPKRPTASASLAREAIGLREVLFQSITHMAPAAAVAFSIPFGAPFAGGALPLAVILALVGCLLVASSIGQLAKHLPSAGSFYTYTSRGLHPAIGFLVAWGYALVEPLVAPLLYLILGVTVAGTLNAEFGWSADLWWIWALVGAGIVFALGYLGIQVSAKTGTVLGIFEIGVFTFLAIWLIAKAGQNTFSVFGTRFANVEGFNGFKGVAAGSVYTILAFIGFEAAAPLAEEARDPTRTIKRAVIGSAVAIGLFYVLTTYGAAVYFGPGKMGAAFQGFNNANPWDGLARAVWGAGWVLVFLAIVNSAIANSNAGANAATRTWYSMGRIRLTFYARERRSEFNALLHAVIPILGILAFVPALFTAVGLPVLPGNFIARLPHPLNKVGIVVLVAYVIGIAYMIWLYLRAPERIQDTGRIFLEEEMEPEQPMAGTPA